MASIKQDNEPEPSDLDPQQKQDSEARMTLVVVVGDNHGTVTNLKSESNINIPTQSVPSDVTTIDETNETTENVNPSNMNPTSLIPAEVTIPETFFLYTEQQLARAEPNVEPVLIQDENWAAQNYRTIIRNLFNISISFNVKVNGRMACGSCDDESYTVHLVCPLPSRPPIGYYLTTKETGSCIEVFWEDSNEPLFALCLKGSGRTADGQDCCCLSRDLIPVFTCGLTPSPSSTLPPRHIGNIECILSEVAERMVTNCVIRNKLTGDIFKSSRYEMPEQQGLFFNSRYPVDGIAVTGRHGFVVARVLPTKVVVSRYKDRVTNYSLQFTSYMSDRADSKTLLLSLMLTWVIFRKGNQSKSSLVLFFIIIVIFGVILLVVLLHRYTVL